MPEDLVLQLLTGIREGRRASVSRAITLVESTKPAHRELARQLLTRLADTRPATSDHSTRNR